MGVKKIGVMAVTAAMLAVHPLSVALGGTEVPFTEEFVADSANWYDSSGGSPLDWSAAGGPDGSSFAAGSFNFVGAVMGPRRHWLACQRIRRAIS